MGERPSFDLRRVKQCMKECYDDEYDITAYIEMYRELNKLFSNFGSLFYIVTNELTEKTEILSRYSDSTTNGNPLSYQHVETMLDFELNNELVWLDPRKASHHLESGSRMLLRLHRALEFVLEIIDGVRLSRDNDSTVPIVKSAYEKTISKYHPWLVKQGVYLAVYASPSRKTVLNNLQGVQSREDANKLMLDTVSIGRQLFSGIQKLYADRRMLNLP